MAIKKRETPLKAPPVPCGSCPYRRDVPSGIWARYEYDKLPPYDGETWEQPLAIFMCHQRDGSICGGWLACHDPQELLALRIPKNVDPSVYSYATDVPVFASGAEARAHGLRDYERPAEKALRMMAGLRRKHARRPLVEKAEQCDIAPIRRQGAAMTIIPADPAPQFVKRARKKLGLNQRDFGTLLRLSRHTISRMECGAPVPETTRMAIRLLLSEHDVKIATENRVSPA